MQHEIKIVFPADFSETIASISESIMQLSAQKAEINRLLKSEKKEDQTLLALSSRLENETAELANLREAKLQVIYNEAEHQFNLCDTVIKSSTAGQLLARQMHEFIKNAIDAKATEMIFSFGLNPQDQVQITIADNGKKDIPLERLGKYDWLILVLRVSEKADTAELGGCNLGLATAANFLENVGDGQLHLAQRPEGGAILTLTSSQKPCKIDRFSFANYVWEMIHDLDKKADAFKTEHSKAIETLKEAYHYPETFISKRDKIMAPISTAENSQILFPLPKRKRAMLITPIGQSSSTNSDAFSPLSGTYGLTPTVASPS